MSRRAHRPERLDIAALAAEGAELSGHWRLAELPRLAADEPAGTDISQRGVDWSVRGERNLTSGGQASVWLHLRARADVRRECQRCLQPVSIPLDVDRRLRFEPDESRAAAIDAESEEDVLALEPNVDLRSLVEDELILALPIVPRHEVCPEPLPLPAEEDEPASENPFAVLAGLKRQGSGH